MRSIVINKTQKYLADKIYKNNNNIKLINAKIKSEDETIELGDLLFPNITNIRDFHLEDGQDWDVEISEIDEIKIIQAEQFEAIIKLIGGM